ncbi:MAG: NAD-binding protein [Clostridiales bacterium]|nr:NAD-binding protein [Clostridiales bacterium]
MRLLLVGGHQKANFLTKSLKAKGHHVTIVNEDYDWCKLMSNTHDVICVHGNGTKPYILEDAQASKMDAVVALGNQDAKNLVVCEIAQKQFHVKNTIAIVNDTRNIHLFKALGVSKCISATKMITDIIEQQALLEELYNYTPLENGKIILCELELKEKSPACGKKIWEIGLPENSIVSCLLREEDTIIPKGNTRLKAVDKLMLLADSGEVEKATALLSGR